MEVNEKCECEYCSYCKGSGEVWHSDAGMSPNRYDDMGDYIPCPYCDGDGLISQCLKCACEEEEAEWQEHLEEMEEFKRNQYY